MTCREITDFLIDYQTGELSADQRSCFDEHLAVCPECVEYIRTYDQTVKLGRVACRDDHEGHADVPEKLVQAILAARSKDRSRPSS